MKKAIAIVLCGAMLAGCSEYMGPKEQTGTFMGAATGAILGAAIGSKTKCRGYRCSSGTSTNAVVIGALAGGLLGSHMGRSMDERDKRMYYAAQQNAFEYMPSGSPSNWRNPDTGNYGSVTPQPAYERSSGEYCREYTQTIVVGGERKQGYGTACRNSDDTWEIVSNR